MTGVVAVTGATGFVGAECVRHLAAAGWRVRVLTRRMPQAALMPDHTIEVVLGDLDDSASLQRLVTGADAILHCAGLVKAPTPEAFFAANAAGTENILRAAAEAAPQARLIHISSLAARAPQLSPYAASKQAAEKKVTELAGPRDWIILRPPVVYGPGDRELLPLFKAAQIGFVAYPASTGARVATIHIADLAEAIVALLAAPSWAEHQIELDDGAVNAHDWPGILSALSKAVGRTPLALRLPRALLLPIAAGVTLFSRLTGQPKVLSLRKVPELYHPDWVARGPSLSRVANWQPRFSLTAGFADTAAWYRSQALL
jgi:nucleoside-diphosphate-sugar epimerase